MEKQKTHWTNVEVLKTMESSSSQEQEKVVKYLEITLKEDVNSLARQLFNKIDGYQVENEFHEVLLNFKERAFAKSLWDEISVRDFFIDSVFIKAIRSASSSIECEPSIYHLYKKLRSPGINYILGRIQDSEVAEEIFEKSIMIFKKKIEDGSFKHRSTIKTFIFSICKNLCKKQLSRRKNGNTIELQLSKHQVIDESENLWEMVMNKDIKNILLEIIKRLDEKCQYYLEEYFYMQRRHKEMAHNRGIRVSSVTTAISRCMEKLRKLIDQNEKLKIVLKERLWEILNK